jgi:hypothetical protein
MIDRQQFDLVAFRPELPALQTARIVVAEESMHLRTEIAQAHATIPPCVPGGELGHALGSGGADIVEHDFLRRYKLGRHLRNFAGDFQRYASHSVQIAMQQIAVVNRQPTNVYRQPDVENMTIGMRANRARSEHRKLDRTHLLDIASGAGRDQSHRSKSFVSRTHHLAKRGGHRRRVSSGILSNRPTEGAGELVKRGDRPLPPAGLDDELFAPLWALLAQTDFRAQVEKLGGYSCAETGRRIR